VDRERRNNKDIKDRGILYPFPLMSKEERSSDVAINAKGGDCWHCEE